MRSKLFVANSKATDIKRKFVFCLLPFAFCLLPFLSVRECLESNKYLLADNSDRKGVPISQYTQGHLTKLKKETRN